MKTTDPTHAAMAVVTYRYRVTNLTGELKRMARAVNFVWNFANDSQRHAVKWAKKWPSGYDLQKLAAGTSIDLKISSGTIDSVCKRYEQSRRLHRKAYLRYRGRKSLGWIPLRGCYIRPEVSGFRFYGKIYRVRMSRPLPDGAKILDGASFSQDALGHWYINLPVKIVCLPKTAMQDVGIDLGLKTLAKLSDGTAIEAPRHYRVLEQKLAIAQRAHKRRQTTAIHAKIAARRRDFLHKASTAIANRFGMVAVGNVNAAKLAKTRMAKSVLDAGWSDFRNQLAYKMRLRGGRYVEVNEANTTRTCGECGCLTGPQGRKGLSIREWACSECGAIHDRDLNAARLILRRAHSTLLAGAAV